MADVLVRNTGDPRQVKRAARTERERDDELLAALRAVLDTEPGRVVLIAILNECHMQESAWAGDPLVMAKLVGQQDVGYRIIEWLNRTDVVGYPKLLAEARRRDERIAMGARLTREREEDQEDNL
jgi:hypothetical protein